MISGTLSGTQKFFLPSAFKTILVGAGFVAMTSMSASAVTIDFEALIPPLPGDNFTIDAVPIANVGDQGGSYVEDGFTLKALGGFAVTPLDLTDNDRFSVLGSNDARFAGVIGNNIQMFNDNATAPGGVDHGKTQLRRTDNGLFDIASIDLAALDGSQIVNSTIAIEFTGTKADTSTVSQVLSFQFDGNFALQTLNFNASFVELEELSWFNIGGSTAGFHQFDNIEVTETVIQNPDPDPVPEPGTLAMMAIGLFGLAAAVRRRKTYSA